MSDVDDFLKAIARIQQQGSGHNRIRFTIGGRPIAQIGGPSKPKKPKKPAAPTDMQEAPDTWNLGESLLNLLSLGSAPVASAGQGLAAALERAARMKTGQGLTAADREIAQKAKSGDVLGVFGQAVGETTDTYYGGINDTLGAIFGGGDPTKIPNGTKNYARVQDALVGMGEISPRHKLNDTELAVAGIGTDILTDPTTYLTLGLSGLVKGAFQGAAKAGTTGGKALIRAAQATEAAPAGTILDRAVTASDRLAGAVEGAGAGFSKEAGRFWIGDLIKARKARAALATGGRLAGGLDPANLGGAAARAADDEAVAGEGLAAALRPDAEAAAATGAKLVDQADGAAELGEQIAARTTSDGVDALADDILGNVPMTATFKQQVADSWGGALAKSASMFARGTQGALRAVKPFTEKEVIAPLTSVGDAGERDAMGGVVSFWKQASSGKPLSKPRAALKPQLDAVAKTRIPLARLDEVAPNLATVLRDLGARSTSRATTRTTVDAREILDLLSSGKLAAAVRTLEKGGKTAKPADRIGELLGAGREGRLELLRAADGEARAVLSDLVEKTSAKFTKGATGVPIAVQRQAWKENLTALLARTARGVPSDSTWAARTADELSKITDPAELAQRLDAIATSVHLVAHRGPKEFFDYIERMPAREVLQQISGQGIRDFAKMIGLPVKGNTTTVLSGLRKGGYLAYREAMETNRQAVHSFAGFSVAGEDLIDEGVRALGNDVTEVKVQLMRRADEAMRDPQVAEDVIAGLSPAMRRNLSGKAEKIKPTQAGELEAVTPIVLKDGTKSEPKHIIQRVEDFTQYESFKGTFARVVARADQLGLAGAERGKYLDDEMMKALTAQDAYLTARGMPPTSRMTDAEKTFRLGGKDGLQHQSEVAFLSLREVLEEIPQAQRIALLYAGKHHTIPPTLLHMLGRWAIRRFEAPTAEIAEQVASYRNAFIQQAWKGIDAKSTGLFSTNRPRANAMGAIADQILTDPDVVARLTQKHIHNGIVARGVWADAAASASMPIRNAFREAMTSVSLSAGAKIEDLLAFDGKIAAAIGQAGIEDELVQSMAHLDASMVAGELVSPDLFYTARTSAAARAASAVSDSGKALTDAELLEVQRQWGDDVMQDVLAGVGKEGGVTRLKETVRTVAAREGEATSNERFLRDAQPDLTEAMDGIVKGQQRLGNELGHQDLAGLEANLDMMAGFSNKTLQGLFTKFKKMYGAEDADMLRVMAQFAPVQATARFGQGLAVVAKKWATPEGAIANPVLVSGWKLQQRMDVPVKLPDGTVTTGQRVMAAYYDAVKGGIATGAARSAALSARESLRHVLAQVGGSEVGDDVLEAAVDLWPAVSVVFDSSAHGLFARAGNNADDMNAILDAFQRKDLDGKALELYGGFHFTRNGTAGDLVHAWRSIGAAGQNIDPIEILRSTHAALQHATVAPTVAASFSRRFGHEAFGLSREEAIRKGWKLPYKRDDVGRIPFTKYLDPTQLYDPEHISKLRYLDDLLQAVQKPGPGMMKVLARIDPIVMAMKSSITIWRPGHWMTNIMGEAWMNTFAGVTNPRRYQEAIGMMVRNHRMVKPDMSPFDDYFARNVPEGRMASAYDIDAPVTELAIGGQLRQVPDELLYRGMEQRGIVLSHVQADDVAFDPVSGAAKIGQKKPLQSVRNINAALGSGSVARDSVFRVAHALDVMRKGQYRSLDEALDAAAAQVHKWHPSYQTLTPFDQFYTRRVLYFYTWMRQAIARMFELSLNQPSLAALPSRVQYAIAYGNGLDPESIGSPVAAGSIAFPVGADGTDEDSIPDINTRKTKPEETGTILPDYLDGNLYGSAISGGAASLLGLDPERVYGMSTNAPTLDIFNQLLGPLTVDPTLTPEDNFGNMLGNWTERNLGQMLTPAITVPLSLATDRTVRGQNYEPGGGFAARAQNLVDQTGLGYISKISGQIAPGVERTDTRADAGDQDERQLLALINAITGMKFTSQSAGNVHDAAKRDERDRLKRWLEQQAQQQAAG